jgi:hypothetical protein
LFLQIRPASIILFSLLLLSGPRKWFGEFNSFMASGSSSVYYVDSANGNDASLGTAPAAAWKTLAKVNATTFRGGAHILLQSGASFTGQLWPKGSGTEQQPIVIDKYGGDAKPIINAAGESEDAVLLKNQEYWEINNLQITNTGTHAGVRRGVNVVAENSGDLHHIYLRGLDIHDVSGVDTDKANGGIMYHCIGDAKPSRFVDLRIENNHIHHVDRSGIFGWSTHWIRSKWYPSLGVVIRNNVLDDIGADGIVPVATDGALVEYNVVGNANQRSQGYNDGIWPWSADNTVVQFNEVYGMKGQRDGMGFDSDWNSRNTIIQYNYSHDNEGGFLLICNDGSQKPSDSIGNVGTIIRYNISQNDHHRGINISGPVSNATIYNNTIYTGENDKVDIVLQSDWHGWSSDIFFYNNIFYVAGSGQFSHATSHGEDGVYVTAAGMGTSQNDVFDFNVYAGNVKPMEIDKHALSSNPLFVDPGRAGSGLETVSAYSLRPGSPEIGSGRILTDSGGRDFFGTAVPSCAGVDRGAVQSKSNCGKAR